MIKADAKDLFLGFELANHIVAYLSRGHLYEESSSNQDIYPGTSDTPEFSQEEKEIISYLAGYARGTLSRRIRSSKDWNTKTNQDNLKILLQEGQLLITKILD